MTSVQDKFVSLRKLKAPVRIVSADGAKADAVAIGATEMELKNVITVTLSDVLYLLDVDGSLISVSKLAQTSIVAEFSKTSVSFASSTPLSWKLSALGASTSSRQWETTMWHERE